MGERNKMICPDCGAEMNHHANKLGYSSAVDEAEAMEADLDGVLQEAHTCPECGQTALRPAADDE